jgi:hypothetical protein
MKKRMTIILLLCFSAGYGIVKLVEHNAPPIVEISEGEVTINDPSDVKEYIIGLKQ